MNKNKFANDLVHWYIDNHRDLPWRKTSNPYYIWISEIMLQQTQVATVIPYYQHFIASFPTVANLAAAPLEEVYKCWEGLGYYSRARNLQAAAKQIIEENQGKFPEDYESLLKLKGIGPYTAAAIASIAFNQPKGVVDGNVLRILSRIYQRDDNIALDKTKKAYQVLCDELIKNVNPSFFNQGLMDLGATICKPQHPLCESCPVQKHCLAFKNQQQEVLPVNIKKVKHQEISYITCIIHNENQEYFLYKNTQGLLQNLYGLPQFDVESPHAFEAAFEEAFHDSIEIYAFLKDVSHVFTHKTWRMHVYAARFTKPASLKLYNWSEIEQLPLSTAHKKLFKLIQH